MPATYTPILSGQVQDFEDLCLLIQYGRLLCDFCSSGQCFAYGFLQILPRDRHPCLRLTVPPAGPVGDLHPQVVAPCRAHIKKPDRTRRPGYWRRRKLKRMTFQSVKRPTVVNGSISFYTNFKNVSHPSYNRPDGSRPSYNRPQVFFSPVALRTVRKILAILLQDD
jgi:hypothetical protein